MKILTNWPRVKKIAVLASAVAVGVALVAPATTTTAGVATSEDPVVEFVYDPSTDGLLHMASARYQEEYELAQLLNFAAEGPDAGYPSNSYSDFVGDGGFVFDESDEGRRNAALLYDAGAPSGARFAYMVYGRYADYSGFDIIRLDHTGTWDYVGWISSSSSGYSSSNYRNWTMLQNGDLIFFDDAGKLFNFGDLRSLTTSYTDKVSVRATTPLTHSSETSSGSEGTVRTGHVMLSTMRIDSTEYVLAWTPGGDVSLYNAGTLAFVGDLDLSGSVDIQGATGWWGTDTVVQSVASIGDTAYVQYTYSTPVSTAGFASLAVLSPSDVDVAGLSADLSTRLSSTEYNSYTTVAIQAPAVATQISLPDAPPAVSHLDYDVNGGSSTEPDLQTGETAATTTVSSTTPTYDGYNFAGWNTAANGSGTDYAAGSNYTLPSTAGVTDTVYAQWAQTPGTASCSTGTGFIQALKDADNTDIVLFKKLSLDPDVMDYVEMDPAVSLDLAALGFSGASFNSTAIDKATGKMFATINDGADVWLVQFDLASTPNMAFLGKVVHPGTNGGFSGTVTSDGTYVMNYYIDGLVEIPNVSSLTAYGSPEAASGVTLGTVHNTTDLGWHGDLASITLSDGSEHVVGYNPATNKVILAPVDDLSNPVAYTTALPGSFSPSGENLGASWSTDDTVYFSRNDGGGVFAVSANDIDTATQSLVMRATEITETISTNSNDGFGCVPTAEAPEVATPTSSSALSCSAWAGLIWVQNQGDTSTNDYQDANTSQFFLFDPATGTLDADGLDDASTWVYDWSALGYEMSINATGVDPTTNIMYGTAKVDGVTYVASFSPDGTTAFYAKGRVNASDVTISNTANGFVDAEGHYWIKEGSGSLYRSQQPLSSYEGFANYNNVTDPMVFDQISTGDFGSVSDIAVIPTANGYLAAGFFRNTLYWGTWNSTTDVWTAGSSATITTGGVNPADYGAVFVDGVSSNGGTLDYSNASIYFTPNAGWDPESETGRRAVKLAVADALDGITSDDLVLLESVPTPATGWNDGASMAGCGLQLPDPLGSLHGWMWADVDGDGSRSAVEPTGGMFGDEAVVTGYSATVISETDWTTLQGVVAVPAGTRYPATVDADGKWSVDGLAAGADPTGVVQTFKVEFDYTDATWPSGFTPAGYTVKGGTTETDSDVPVTAGATATSVGGFTVTADTSTHAADAGVTNPLPPVPVTFDEQGGTEVDDLTCEIGGSFQVPAAPTRDGYTFAGWNSAADGSGSSYVAGTDYDCAELTIYALWTQNPLSVTFDEQGGTEVDDLTCEIGGTFQVPAAPTRDGYTFAGWNSAADGSGSSYVVDTDYDCAELTIYALWTQNPTDTSTTTTTVAPETTTTTVAPETTTTTVAPETTSTTVPVLLPATGSESRLVPMLVLLVSIGAGLVLMRRRVVDNS